MDNRVFSLRCCASCAAQPVSAASLASATVTARKTFDVAPRTSANAASLRRKRSSLALAAKAAIWFVVLLMLGRAARAVRKAAPQRGHWVEQRVARNWRDDVLPRAAPAQPTANRGAAARGRGAGRATRGGRGGRGGRGRGRPVCRDENGLSREQRDTAAWRAAQERRRFVKKKWRRGHGPRPRRRPAAAKRAAGDARPSSRRALGVRRRGYRGGGSGASQDVRLPPGAAEKEACGGGLAYCRGGFAIRSRRCQFRWGYGCAG